jgi:hypothetical protein
MALQSFVKQFDLIVVLSWVLCIICLLLCVFVVPYCITTATGLTTHLQSNNNKNNIDFWSFLNAYDHNISNSGAFCLLIFTLSTSGAF